MWRNCALSSYNRVTISARLVEMSLRRWRNCDAVIFSEAIQRASAGLQRGRHRFVRLLLLAHAIIAPTIAEASMAAPMVVAAGMRNNKPPRHSTIAVK